MPHIKHIPPCKCGCGEPTDLYYYKGRFKNYLTYKIDHRPAPLSEEERKSRARARSQACRDRKYGSQRGYWLQKRYGMTLDDFDRLLKEQEGTCALCRAAPATDVDHNHRTGRVRGLLCGPCNRHLGSVEKMATVDGLVDYLTCRRTA